ncbi:MAG: YIP1 family protein [Candidatus Saccharibacteria bacterium]
MEVKVNTLEERPIIEEPQPWDEMQSSEDAVNLNVGQKLIGVIVSPIETFKSIAKSPDIVYPMLIIIGISLISILIIWPELQQGVREQILKSGQSIPPEQMKFAMTMAGVGALVSVFILTPIIWLIQAVVLLIYDQITIAKASFKQLFSVAVYSSVPSMFSSIVKTGAMKSMGLMGATKVQTSFALFLPPDIKSGFLFFFLSQLDFFIMWAIVLLALGGGVVMQTDAKKIGIYVFILWLLFAAGAAGLGMLGAAMQPSA